MKRAIFGKFDIGLLHSSLPYAMLQPYPADQAGFCLILVKKGLIRSKNEGDASQMKGKQIKMNVRNLIYRFGVPLAAVALFMTRLSVNAACSWLGHQPVIPQQANKLKKF